MEQLTIIEENGNLSIEVSGTSYDVLMYPVNDEPLFYFMDIPTLKQNRIGSWVGKEFNYSEEVKLWYDTHIAFNQTSFQTAGKTPFLVEKDVVTARWYFDVRQDGVYVIRDSEEWGRFGACTYLVSNGALIGEHKILTIPFIE